MTPTDPAPPQSNDTADNPCELAIRDGIATVTLNRPAIHNAFDERLIAKLTHAPMLSLSSGGCAPRGTDAAGADKARLTTDTSSLRSNGLGRYSKAPRSVARTR